MEVSIPQHLRAANVDWEAGLDPEAGGLVLLGAAVMAKVPIPRLIVFIAAEEH